MSTGPVAVPRVEPGHARVVGVGIDLVDVDRFRASLARTPTLADRLFTAEEQAYAGTAKDPTLRLAARFAAKEAAMKSLGVGVGRFKWREVSVARDATGRPSLVVVGGARTVADDLEVVGWQLSLTHTGTSAGAVVIALGG